VNVHQPVHSGERQVLCGSLLDISHENGRSLLCMTAAPTTSWRIDGLWSGNIKDIKRIVFVLTEFVCWLSGCL